MEQNTIFHYRLTDAWVRPLCEISINKNGSQASADYKIINGNEGKIELNYDVIQKIHAVMEMHPKIFEYTDLEDPSDLLDGVMNFFEFTAPDGKNVHLLAFNIEEVRNPDAHFSPSLRECCDGEDSERNVTPIRAMEVVKTFDEIADILVRNGVPQDCLSLDFKQSFLE